VRGHGRAPGLHFDLQREIMHIAGLPHDDLVLLAIIGGKSKLVLDARMLATVSLPSGVLSIFGSFGSVLSVGCIVDGLISQYP